MNEATEQAAEAPAVDVKAASSSVEAAVARIDAKLDRLKGTNEATRWMLLIAAVLLVVEVAVFLYATYSRITSNFQQQQVVEAMQTPMQELRPQVESQAQRVFAKVAPVYQEQAAARLQTVGPQLGDAMAEQARALPDKLYIDARNQLEEGLEHVASRLRTDMARQFPELSSPGVQERLAEHFDASFHSEFGDVGENLKKNFERELTRVNGALASFNVPLEMTRSDYPLERNFVHNLLMLVDYELMNADEAMEDLEAAQGK